jgi:filamentous hemagglutinin family protein
MSDYCVYFKSLGFIIFLTIAVSASSAIAQISPDGTLPNNSSVRTVVTPEGNIIFIEGGTQVQSNLFHSFTQFSIGENTTAEFTNINGIQNIISRVTGNSVSQIDGILKTQPGATANLFLINPNGIVFGPKATLNIGGSFLATTASSLNFEDGRNFSATDTQSTSLLSVSVPVGLQFGQTAAPIRNLSQGPDGVKSIFAQPVGLQVQAGKTLTLVGGDINLEGGNLTAESGRIELGSVAGGSLVKLNQTNNGWILGYEGVRNFQNIQLTERNANGINTASVVDTSGTNGGNIQLNGNSVELVGSSVLLRSNTTGSGNGLELNINANKLIVRDGAQVSTDTTGSGNGGNLTVNASEFVEVIGNATTTINGQELYRPSSISTSTGGIGNAGEMTINTRRLSIKNRARIATVSIGEGVFTVAGIGIVPARGNGGTLTLNASESVEITERSELAALTNSFGNAGKVIINSPKLVVQDQGVISVSSEFATFPYVGEPPLLGTAGEINVNADSILLDNKGQISSISQASGGGNILLQMRNALVMRGNSQISTNAGTVNAPGNGGNITINAPNGFLVATAEENNDITANAFSGAGGKITINAKSILGFVQRDRSELISLLGTDDPKKLDPSKLPTNDITAFSQQNPSLNGIIEINTPDADPSKGLLELPTEPVDASRQIATGCRPGGKLNQGSLVATGRGGIATSPTEPLMNDAVLVGWINLDSESVSSASTQHHADKQKMDYVNKPTQIISAQGWVMDSQGNVTLVAQAPTVTPHSPVLNAASCAAN